VPIEALSLEGLCVIVADLVATLTLDDQMSASLAKVGQQIDAFAAKGGKIAGELLVGWDGARDGATPRPVSRRRTR